MIIGEAEPNKGVEQIWDYALRLFLFLNKYNIEDRPSSAMCIAIGFLIRRVHG